MPGKWLRMYHGSHFVSPVFPILPADYTVEFDLAMSLKAEGYIYPSLTFRLFESVAGDADARKYLLDDNNRNTVTALDYTLFPGIEESSEISLSSTMKGSPYFRNDHKRMPRMSGHFHKPVHVAIWVQHQRIRIWMNEEKVYDIPQAVPAGSAFNRFAIALPGSVQEPEDLGYYITNLKFAAGAPDMRTKLITEGKLVTHGILFDVNADRIKPASYGVLKEIAAVLQANKDVKVSIVGHTDSDGADAGNLSLSRRRAAAVKDALVKAFAIEAARLQTDGKGESQPVADNGSTEGKARNRRVEFIKL
jgi:outer membrane protein OmpA-like peptidoglycan-associated protein